MVAIVCYSHSDYLDILQVQCSYLRKLQCPLYLCLNMSLGLSPFTSVLQYDDTLRYSKRLLQSIKQIEDDYILFIHDMDIVIDIDESIMDKIVDTMKEHGIDRVDLRNKGGPLDIPLEETAGLAKTVSMSWRYNVGPSLWKMSALRSILEQFDKCYRTIEDEETQEFCKQMSFYHIEHPVGIDTAFFRVCPWFVYIHITSVGKLIPEKNNGMCPYLQDIYSSILQTFALKRPMKQALYGFL
jgi:hypothetical protein